MNAINARRWSRGRYTSVMLGLLIPVIVLQIFASDLDGAAFYIASTVNIALAVSALYITFTFTRRADELRKEREEGRR